MPKRFRFKSEQDELNFSVEVSAIVEALTLPLDASNLTNNSTSLNNTDLDILFRIRQSMNFIKSMSIPFIAELLLKYHLMRISENDINFFQFTGDGHNLENLYKQLNQLDCNFKKELQSKYTELMNRNDYYNDGGEIVLSVDDLISHTKFMFEANRYKHFQEIDKNGNNIINKSNDEAKSGKFNMCLLLLIKSLYLLSDLPKKSNKHINILLNNLYVKC